MTTYVVTYRYQPEPDRMARLRGERYAYFGRLQEQGMLLASGQLLDGDLGEGMLVLQADAGQDVGALLDEDPFVREGLVVRREIARWHPTTGSWVA